MLVTKKLAVGALALVAGLGMIGCGQDDTPGSAASATPKAAAPVGAASGVVKVSANTATEKELVDALGSAGVPNAAKWADEITEYRPYAAGDSDLPKLRRKLAKYNPAPGVVDKIVSVLTP